MKTKIILSIILVVSIFIRFYNFNAWFGFDYDQEVNAWLAKTVVIDHKPILIGPETSVGGMYVGPYFNYILASFYALGKMDPVTTIYLNVLLSVSTILLMYYVGKKVFNEQTGIIAAIIYGFSYNLTNFDRVSWNPTPIPLVSLGIIFTIYLYLTQWKYWQLAMSLFLTGFMFHLHFTALFITMFLAISLAVFGGRKFFRSISNYFLIFGMTIFFFAPIIFFDLRHDFLITHHFVSFLLFTGSNAPISRNIFWIFVTFVRSIFYNDTNSPLDLVALALLVGIIYHSTQVQKSQRLFFILGFVLFTIPILTLSLYRGPLPAHYLLFTLPIVVILVASYLGSVFQNKVGKFIVVVGLGLFLFYNIPATISTQSGLALQYKKQVASYVISDAKGKSFKVDFISEPGRKTGFSYLFWLSGKPLLEDMTVKTDKIYKVVVPYFLVPEADLSARFGGIGIIKVQ